ncbi:MAG: DUF4403 family protein [Aquamicrobium sp.]|uniref:DUF4403 family protein n=1 Tax=Aquamicrobium sp. TaxID=1872579 RepID=UPI00349E7CD1|nr:DUF4403 family protein [Aquamicrobium sp.]
MKRNILTAVAAVALLGGGWLAVDWYRSAETAMSQKPPHQAGSVPLEASESVVLANLTVGYPVIAQALNQAIDDVSGTQNGSEEIRCVSNSFPRFRECLTVNWSIEYGRNGDIAVGRDGSMLKVTVPGRFAGTAGFGGGIARLLSLHAKRFDGAFEVSASAALSLDERFCPVLTPGEVSFHWTNEGRIQLVGRTGFSILGIGFSVGPWNLEVGRHANGPIREALRKALADAGRAIPCDPVRQELAKAWRHYAFPLAIDGMPTLFVNVEPTGLGTSGLLAEDAGVRLAARMTAKAVVETGKGSEETMGELPVHETVSTEQGELSLAVPLKVPYRLLKAEAMKELAGKTLTSGDARFEVHDLDIYPSGDRLAVGVAFSTDIPWRIFDAKGMVWVTARPVVEGDGKIVRLEDVEVSRQVDSALWSVLTAAFRDVIHDQLEAAARYDLSPDADRAVAGITEAVSDPARTGGVRFQLEHADIGVGRIVAEEEALAVEGLLKAKWDAFLDEIRL